ncbi:MAG: hypothetical protein ACKO0W_01995 [Planctomycetota bacterium]
MTQRSDRALNFGLNFGRTTGGTPFRTVVAAATAVALAALGGCAAHRTPEDDVLRARRVVNDLFNARTFAFEEPLELRTTGPLAVDIDNFSGSVTVRADRDVDRTVVEVRRIASHGLGRWIESVEALDDASWTASLSDREGGGEMLTILTDTPNPERHFHSLEILVVTPALDAVKIRNKRGHVTVVENQGPVDIETTRGDVRMMTPWPMTGPMTIVTNEGAIDYRVRGESKGVFDCESIGGEVRQRCEFGKWRALDPENDHDRFLAVLNEGTNPVVLRTTVGNIRVAVVPDPVRVGSMIVDP